MKKLLTLAAIFIASLTIANAQTEKGNQTLGIDAGFSHQKTDLINISADQGVTPQTSKYNSFNIGPNYSYFIADNLDLGAGVDYNSTKTDNTYAPYSLLTQSSKSFSAAIYMRKYFLYENKIGLRVGPYLSYIHSTQDYVYSADSGIPASSGKGDTFFASGKIDFVYFPTKKIGIAATVANLYYQHFKNNNYSQGSNSGDQFGLNLINSNLNFSIFYVFGGKG